MVGRFALQYSAAPEFFACVLVYGTIAAAQHRPAPQPVISGAVQSIVGGDTLVLRSGVLVRLAGIQAPKLPLGRRGSGHGRLPTKPRRPWRV